MTTRKYSSRSQQTTLTAAVTAGDTTISVVSGTALLGGVTIPAGTTFTLVIDPDTALEEIVDATAVSTNTFTIVRGIDGSSGVEHSAGATVRHMAIGRDYRDANLHAEASASYNDGAGNAHTMHGIAAGEGDVVGTAKSQTLTNKTLTSPTINGGTLAGAVTASATVTLTGSVVVSGGTITGLSSAGMVASSATPKDYVDNILGSATAAATSAASAAASATAAATSAASAATSASSAATSASSAAASATAAATSASSAAVSATAASTSASSAAASATAAATSASSASVSASAAATSAASASTSASSALTSATSAATSATSAAASAALAAAYGSAPVEFRQFSAAGSVLDNLPSRLDPAEQLLKQAVFWVDSAHSSASGQTVSNLGWSGSVLNATCGSSSVADSNDPRFLSWDGTNYVYIPGNVTSNFVNVTSSQVTSVTGDIDIRVQAALDTWTPSTAGAFIGSTVGDPNRRFRFNVNTTGNLNLTWWPTGLVGSQITVNSTVATGFSAGQTAWVRVTLDVDNGASGNTVTFYTSTDGVNWVQLGSPVVTAGTTSIYAANADYNFYGNVGLDGKLFRAQILNGINGTPVLDVDTSVISSGSATSFTALSGQTVTINRGPSGRKNVAVTHPVWLFGTDDYIEVNNRWIPQGSNGQAIRLPGVAGNEIAIADSSALDITGDIDIRMYVALDDWTPAAVGRFLAKWDTTTNNRSYSLSITFSGANNGYLTLSTSPDGTNAVNATSTAEVPAVDGQAIWIRATRDVDNGASGNDTRFFTSTDGTTWTQLGSTVTVAGVTSIYAGTSYLSIGQLNNSTQTIAGRVFRAQVLNGIGGTTVLDVDASRSTVGATTFTAVTGQTVTLNGSGVSVIPAAGVYLPGVAGNYLSAPDSSALDITGDIDIRVKVALDDWTPSAENMLLAKWQVSGNFSYSFSVLNTGTLHFRYSADGSAQQTRVSTVAPTVADGATLWVRATRNSTTGDVLFYTSTDGSSWTQLGTTVTGATGAMFSGTSIIELGSRLAGTALNAQGRFYRAQIRNGIDGTIVFDANMETSITSLTQTMFTESSSNAATVTINKSGTGYVSTPIVQSGYIYPTGTSNLTPATFSLLDFGATDSFTVLAVVRQWATPPSFAGIVAKRVSSGWSLQNNGTANQAWGNVSDGTNSATPTGSVVSAGTATVYGLLVDRGANTAAAITGSTIGSTSSISTVGSLANSNPVWIGRATAGYATGEFIAAAIFRRALTSSEITTLSNYFAGRAA